MANLSKSYDLTEAVTLYVKDTDNVSWASYSVNGTKYKNETITITGQDIVIKGGGPLRTGSTAPTLTIHYEP